MIRLSFRLCVADALEKGAFASVGNPNETDIRNGGHLEREAGSLTVGSTFRDISRRATARSECHVATAAATTTSGGDSTIRHAEVVKKCAGRVGAVPDKSALGNIEESVFARGAVLLLGRAIGTGGSAMCCVQVAEARDAAGRAEFDRAAMTTAATGGNAALA